MNTPAVLAFTLALASHDLRRDCRFIASKGARGGRYSNCQRAKDAATGLRVRDTSGGPNIG